MEKYWQVKNRGLICLGTFLFFMGFMYFAWVSKDLMFIEFGMLFLFSWLLIIELEFEERKE